MKPKIVAHRGESIIAPENTLEAFALAWARGAQAIEGDFHLSQDGVVVCMHDDNAKRTCGVDRKLADMTLAEIKTLDASFVQETPWSLCSVPTLEEVLQAIPPQGEIYIELKAVGAIVEAVKQVFAKCKCRPEQLSFIAFDETTISEVKRQFPAHQCYWLTCNRNEQNGPLLSPAELVKKIRSLGVDGVDIADAPYLDESFTRAFREAGLTFHVWTVDAPAEAIRLAKIGVDSITTNQAKVITHAL